MQKAMAPHSSTLAWKIPWTEEPGRLQSMGHEELDTTEWLHFHFSLSCIGEGNGNPLQCCCLENPRDRGAWWAAVYGVAQSQTWLKWLSSSIVFRNSAPSQLSASMKLILSSETFLYIFAKWLYYTFIPLMCHPPCKKAASFYWKQDSTETQGMESEMTCLPSKELNQILHLT